MDDRDQRGGTKGGGDGPPPTESLLPYDRWTEQALRGVVVRALRHAAKEGLPGDHHFYISFRTDAPGVAMPARLRAQYPQEMTIVLQHQFWDLKANEDGFSVGLSFGGVPSTLAIPLDAVVGFADPSVQFGLRFEPVSEEAGTGEAAAEGPAPVETPTEPQADATPQVVSLDAFRRKPKE